ncbi:VOC family protein [Streptomyces sanyensis]|uniref:VOC family protein n=1 Tax=Streptomyces sanyensis TaxID=568869 RepID=UPI003D787A23
MAEAAQGTPVWADATFPDLQAAKDFYGRVLGWTFGEPAPEYGGYTQAYADGRAVAALAPPMEGQDTAAPPLWTLYLASPDVAATAEDIRRNGGHLVLDPMKVGEFGSMCLATDPGGALFGVWQPGTHQGFEAREIPGAYAWAEVFTRTPEQSDAFFTGVFGFTRRAMRDPQIDFAVYGPGEGDPVLGRMTMGEGDFPPEVPSYVQVYFAVPDCDAAVAAAEEAGGRMVFGPLTTPFGRFAALLDPQGAAFAVIDLAAADGEQPAFD